MDVEGVIKFSAQHESRAIAPHHGEQCCRLIAWREIMAMTGLVGQDPTRYDGAGYGNISTRIGPPSSARGQRAMIITATQTSGKPIVGIEDFCVVEHYDYTRNVVRSHGLSMPSSEAMTHGAIYDLSPSIRTVLHAHTPVIWRRAHALRIPRTADHVPYGTVDMAREVSRLYQSTALSEQRILAMGGHEDGVIAFGRSASEAGQTLIDWLARAYELDCRR